MKTHKLTKDQKEHMVKLFLEGKNFNEIAKYFSVTLAAIRYLLNKRGYTARYHGKLIPDIQEKVLTDFATKNFTFKDLAKKYNVSPQSIRNFLNRRNLFAPDQSIARRKYMVNDNFFEHIDSPDKAYILGLFYADGCNSIEFNKIVITLQTGDESILEKIKDLIQPEKPLYYKNPNTHKAKNGKPFKSKGSYTLSIISKKICEDLNKYGMTPRKSLNLKWPNWISDDLMPHFIRGFFDGDGGVSSRGVISFTGNRSFIHDLQFFLSEKGLCPLNKIHSNILSKECCYFNFGSKMHITLFYNWIYKNDPYLFLTRKKYKLQNYIDESDEI